MTDHGSQTVFSTTLSGLSVTTTSGVNVTFVAPPTTPDDDGPAGVREPRRPRPTLPTLAAEAEPDEATIGVAS